MRREMVEIADGIKAKIEKLRQEPKERHQQRKLTPNSNISGRT
jgi:hypothetical protein